MKIDLTQRLQNFSLSARDVYQPLYECITNSIQHIYEAGEEKGEIFINLIRTENPELPLDEGGKDPITSIEVIDNGIGFTDQNFDSFETSDSAHKLRIGGKGVGRFTWLKVFESAHIDSVYKQENKYFRRTFDFLPQGPGIFEHINDELDGAENRRQTKVELKNIRRGFELQKKVSTVAEKIFSHFALQFIHSSCPQITVSDGQDKVKINDYISKVEIVSDKFFLKGIEFAATILKLKFGEQKHEVSLCALERIVESRPLKDFIPHLPDKKITLPIGDCTILATISSEYFDKHTNQERTSLNISQTDDVLFEGEVSKEEIWKEFKNYINEHLGEDLKAVKEEKNSFLREAIENKYPQYRILLSGEYDTELDAIPYPINDQKLENELHRLKYEIESKTRAQVREIMSESVGVDEEEEFQTRTQKVLEKISSLSKDDLAQYVIKRKDILNLLERKLEVVSAEKKTYEMEATIHNVIFPLRATSDNIDFKKHNLWILDEKLVYHKYLTSDIQFAQSPAIESESKTRSDIVIFNGSSTLVNEDSGPYNSIVIIEFKKPMRKNYAQDENPISQVIGYIEEIKKGTALTKGGRRIELASENIPFFCYIVCDIVDKIDAFANLSGLIKAPDHKGYFGYIDHYKAYFEIVSYDKMIADAKKRNRVFFDQLNL